MTKRNVLTFQWDAAETLTSDEYLTPVYFNPQVLVRYFYDSRFSCEFASDTYGTVYGSDFNISFGINSNGTVIVWLGDLMQVLPQREQFYWLVENKEPENNIDSEFKEAQLNAEFTDPPEAIRCLNAIEKLNNKFNEKYSTHLYKPQPFEIRLEATRRYKRLIFNNEDDVKRFLSELNEIINENTNNTGLKSILTNQGISIPSGSKGNKLLQLAYKNILGDTNNLIAPFVHLYDLRLWSDHSGKEDTYKQVLAKLGLSDSATHAEVMSALLESMVLSSKALEALIGT